MHVLPFNLNVTCSTSAVTISGRVERDTEIVSKYYQNEYLSIKQIFFFVNIFVVEFRYIHECRSYGCYFINITNVLSQSVIMYASYSS